MKGSSLSLLILIASAILMVSFQQKAIDQRSKDRQKDLGVAYMERQKMPTAGFDAVLSDFLWMRTNLRRSPRPKKGLSNDEKMKLRIREANRNLAGYSKVVALDPTFSKAYDIAITRIMNDLPDQAISLADMAMIYCGPEKKKFAEIAGHICSTIKKDDKASLPYYEIVVAGAPEKDFLGRRYLRTLLKIDGIDPYDDTLSTVAKRIQRYHKADRDLVGYDQAMEEGAGSDEMRMSDEGSMESWIQPIVLDKIRDFMTRSQQEKVDAKLIKGIQGIYASYSPSGHACGACYNTYEPGDRFCTVCGEGVSAYGVCAEDGTVLRGNFCHLCGLKAGSPKRKAL